MEPYESLKLKPSTKKLYMASLRHLLGKDFTSLSGLKNVEGVDNFINQKKSNSAKRSYYCACVTSLKDKPEFKKEYDIYHAKMMQLNKDTPLSDKKTAKQTNNWMDFSELQALRDSLDAAVRAKIKREKNISGQTFNELLDMCVLSLYTLQTPRRSLDYVTMVVGKPAEDTKNYFYKDTFYFNVFKTSGTYHQQVVPLTLEMSKVLKLYLKYRPKNIDALLVRADGKVVDKSSMITNILNRVTGKRISTSMIRNIFASSSVSEDKAEFQKTLEKLQRIATEMGTSVPVLIQQYTKSD